MNIEYKVVHQRVRPPRFAFLMDRSDPHWIGSCLNLLEAMSWVWGGEQFIVIPTDGRTIDAVFEQLLDLFNPDYLYRYLPTYADVEAEDRSVFSQEVARQWRLRGFGVESPPEWFVDQVRRSGRKHFDLEDSLERALLSITVSFASGHGIPATNAGSKELSDTTGVTDALDPQLPRRTILELSVPGLMQALWVGARLGRTSPELRDRLSEIGFDHNFVPFESAGCEVVAQFIVDGERDRGEAMIARALDCPEAEEFDERPLWPRDLFMEGLQRLRTGFGMGGPVLVVGSTFHDFALWLGLHRIWTPTYWLPGVPSVALDEPGVELLHLAESVLLRLISKARSRQLSLSCVSASLVGSTLEAEVAAVNKRFSEAGAGNVARAAVVSPSLVDPVERTFAKGGTGTSVIVPFLDDQAVAPIPTPVPATFRELRLGDHRWLCDLEVERYGFPRVVRLGTELGQIPHYAEEYIRCSGDGLTYYCPNHTYPGNAVPISVVVRPQPRTPRGIELFRLLGRNVDIGVSASDKAAAAEATLSRLGGLSGFADFYSDTRKRSLLNWFLEKAKQGNERGEHSDGIWIKPEGRAYADFHVIARLLGAQTDAARVTDQLVSNGVFQRGFVLKCRHCNLISWWPLDSRWSDLECRRCRLDQRFDLDAWRSRNDSDAVEPKLFYKLDEMIRMTLEQNSWLPLLVLWRLQRQSLAFEFSHEISYRGEGLSLESDINCVRDGAVILGEAKTTDQLKVEEKNDGTVLKGYYELAVRLGARKLVWATSKPKWCKATLTAIEEVRREYPHVVSEILAASDLGLA